MEITQKLTENYFGNIKLIRSIYIEVLMKNLLLNILIKSEIAHDLVSVNKTATTVKIRCEMLNNVS